ncbi:MAG: RNA polymerase sigma factor [Anaerovoracaceae bacterium]
MDDDNILELFWQRNENAIIETGAKYGKYLNTISINILQNNEDAEECVNDTYLRAWNNIPPQRPNILKVFLGAITRNLSFDCYKKKHAQKRIVNEFSILISELEDCIPDNNSVENVLDNQEIANQISRFLKQLSANKQQIFIRRYWYCQSIKHISKVYGYSQSKVKSSLFETRKKLRQYLEKEGISI